MCGLKVQHVLPSLGEGRKKEKEKEGEGKKKKKKEEGMEEERKGEMKE